MTKTQAMKLAKQIRTWTVIRGACVRTGDIDGAIKLTAKITEAYRKLLAK